MAQTDHIEAMKELEDYTTEIKVANYSIYSSGWYDEHTHGFVKLYKGVRVNVSLTSDGMGFSIRTQKVKDAIWVKPDEKIDSIVFNDVDCSITCNFIRRDDNKSKSTLTFKNEVYVELKTNIPLFLKENGAKFEMVVEEGRIVLNFYCV